MYDCGAITRDACAVVGAGATMRMRRIFDDVKEYIQGKSLNEETLGVTTC